MIALIKETCIDVYRFLKNPVNQPAADQTFKQKVNKLFAVLAMEIPVITFIAMIIYGIEKAGLITTGTHKIDVLFQQLPLWKFVLFGVLISPFIEELIFRLYLRLTPKDFTRYSILPIPVVGKQTVQKIENYLTHLWVNKFRMIFFFSALAFACFHLSNYELSSTVLLLSPLLVAPQFITGLLLGYLRIKYNFMLGYLMHAIHNAFFISISLILIKGGWIL